MSNAIEIKPYFNPKQSIAIKALLSKDNKITEVLYGGAAGGGKSWLGCVFITIMCLKYKGSRNLIGRKTLKRLKLTTLKTLFEVFGQFQIKEGIHYKYNQIDGVIKFFNGSEIILVQLLEKPSDPDADDYGSLELTSAFIDEVAQVGHRIKNTLQSRIRYKLDEFGILPKIFMSCNPSRGWVYSEFYKKKIDGKLESYKEFIPALVTDNPKISEHYIDNLKKLDKVSRARLLEGKWEYGNDLAIFNYDEVVNFLQPKEKVEGKQNYMAVDVARLGKDSTVIFVMNDKGCLLHFEELNQSRINDTVEEIKRIASLYDITNSNIAVDSDGVGGGVVDYLDGCVSIVNNSRAKNDENYQNLKTQLYLKLAERINAGELINTIDFDISIEEKIQQELMVYERVDVDKDGKFKITSKHDVKNQIGRSPDYADALAYMMHFFIAEIFFEDSPVTFYDF